MNHKGALTTRCLTHEQWLGNSESTLFEKGEESKKGVLLAKTSQQCPSKAFSPFSIL